MQSDELEYVGFWARAGACLIDTLLLGAIIWPIVTLLYGESYWLSESFVKGPADFLLSWVLPAIAVIVFWIIKQATPGKMAISSKIVDAATGRKASTSQLVGRYFAYFLSTIPFGVGIIWVAFDERKQGWHDKLARTVVVRKTNRAPKRVEFNG